MRTFGARQPSPARLQRRTYSDSAATVGSTKKAAVAPSATSPVRNCGSVGQPLETAEPIVRLKDEAAKREHRCEVVWVISLGSGSPTAPAVAFARRLRHRPQVPPEQVPDTAVS